MYLTEADKLFTSAELVPSILSNIKYDEKKI